MTICVVGGGAGDGKTTLVELVARHLAARGRQPLVIDCNPDQNLGSYLGFSERELSAQAKIGENFPFLKTTFDARHPQLSVLMPSAPPIWSTRWWDATNSGDPVLRKFALATEDGIALMAAGTYRTGQFGSGCYHDHSGPAEYMLTRLDDGRDGRKKQVLVDNVHGADAFGTPLYALGDVALVVASPTRKSREILALYLDKAAEVQRELGFVVPIAVVGNRLSADPARRDREDGLLREAAQGKLIGSFETDGALMRDLDSNRGPSLADLTPHNRRTLSLIEARIDAADRKWEVRRDWLNHCLGASASWANGAKGTDVTWQKSDFIPAARGHICTDGCGHPVFSGNWPGRRPAKSNLKSEP